MALIKEAVQTISQSIDARRTKYVQTSHEIHDHPEIGNQEFFASSLLISLLEEAGFMVDKGVAGHETAFFARKKSERSGPTIAYLAEYDALPGIGHACGHNIIGTTSVAAAIALSKTLDSAGGEVVVLGTPAEEGGPNGSAKGSLVKHGLLKEIDVALMLHPSGNSAITGPSLAVDPLEFHFYGKPAHAAGSPEKGINALDAVLQLFNSINALRQQLPSDARVHGIITHGGDAPNIIPEYAAARFYIRGDSWKKTADTARKIRAIAEGAALATGATVKIERFQNEVRDLVLTPALDALIRNELEAQGETVADSRISGLGSTDAGNISYEVPTAHGYIKIGPETLIAHTEEFREAAKSDQGDRALIRGAKALANTGYQLLTDNNLLEQIKAAHQESLKVKQQN
ncbi:Catalyzes the cleavage of p-aminobenzoyl-glutamate to p-aminobenzoate and glutamate, subunit A [Planococcus halocryophilus Or1]|uniref:Peptidase M20 domain-containing protein 2 n=1 Tax=Planococcus halocryophilus TaxID=1215089 RepID=A0A1C7DSI5_9BACL|nr:M20 family metallopeptidase [Planococcus halocryophilus]ANU14153.1 amidohydrolase [Planococcus halocryophilus]EMF47249.1 Catalyzes the cleavage of p-aminobenzoyl-glutamate to p-aminobenzoate and glutamate, subunit A [Planococcus halocryophilus Or1]